MIIAIDFDGTCVTHEYPYIGRPIGAEKVLKALVDNGHKLVLNTMRCEEYLERAINWFNTNDIPLYGANINPEQKKWTKSPKVYAQLYIDDASLGCPVKRYKDRVYVDWKQVILILEEYGCLLPEEIPNLMKEIITAQNDLALFQ